MSRGRGQSGSRGASWKQTTPARAGISSAQRLQLYRSRLANQLRWELPDGKDETSYWQTDGRHFLTTLSDGAVVEALKAGDWQGARSITSEYHSRLGDALRAREAAFGPDEEAKSAAVWARMRPWLKRGSAWASPDALDRTKEGDFGFGETFLQSWGNSSVDLVSGFRAEALRVEQRRNSWTAEDGQTRPFDLVHADAEAAWRSARSGIASSPATGPLRVSIQLTHDAFTDLVVAHRDEEGFRGVVGGVAKGRDTYYAVATLDREIDGRSVRFRLVTDVDSFVPEGSRVTHSEVAAAFAADHGLGGDLRPDGDRIALGDLSVTASWDRGISGRALSADEAFGPDVCQHQGARWERSGCHARLVCDRCFNGAAASVPAHRLPPEHPLHEDIGSDPAYLAELRYWDAVHSRPEGHSEAETRFVSVDPADYARTGRGAGRPPRPASVAEAMKRR